MVLSIRAACATSLLLEVKGQNPEASAIGLRDIQTENLVGTDHSVEVLATAYWRLTPLQMRRVDSGKPYVLKSEFMLAAGQSLATALAEKRVKRLVSGSLADLDTFKGWLDSPTAVPKQLPGGATLPTAARAAVGHHHLQSIQGQTPRASWLFQRARAVPSKPQSVQNLVWHCYGYSLDGSHLSPDCPATVWEVLLETPPLPLNLRTDALPGDYKLELRLSLDGDAAEVETFMPTAVTPVKAQPGPSTDRSSQLGAGDNSPRVFEIRLSGATAEDASRAASANADLPTRLRSGSVTLSDVLMLPGFLANMVTSATNSRVSFGIVNSRGKNQTMYGLTIPLAKIGGRGRPSLVDFGATVAYADGLFAGGTIGFGRGLLQISIGAYHRDGRKMDYATGYHVDIGRALLGDYDKVKEPVNVILEATGIIPCLDRLRSLDGMVWEFNGNALGKSLPGGGRAAGQVYVKEGQGSTLLETHTGNGPADQVAPAPAPDASGMILGQGLDDLKMSGSTALQIKLWVVHNGQIVSDVALLAGVVGGNQLSVTKTGEAYAVEFKGKAPATIALLAVDKTGKVIAQRTLAVNVAK